MANIKAKINKFLTWSGEYAHTDMRYIVKGGFWLTFGRIAAMGTTFLLSVAFANLVSPETYGTYKYILSIYGLLAIITLPGISIALVQSVAGGYEGSITKIIKTKIKWGIAGSLGSLVVAGYYLWNGNSDFAIAFFIVSAFLPFIDTFDLYGSVFSGKQDFKNFAAYTTVPSIIVSGMLIGTLFFTNKAYLIALVYFAAWTLARFITLKVALLKFPLNKNEDPGVISYGKNLTWMNIINHVAGYVDKLFVFLFVGPAELAIYSIAIAPPEQVKNLLSQINDLMFPRLAERSDEEIKAGMKNKYIKLFILGVIVVGGYILLAPYFFSMFFPKYGQSVLLSQIFSISMLNVTAIAPGVYLMAKKKTKELYYSNAIISVFQIISMGILTYLLGLWGLVIARVITRLFSPLITIYYYNKTVGQETAS